MTEEFRGIGQIFWGKKSWYYFDMKISYNWDSEYVKSVAWLRPHSSAGRWLGYNTPHHIHTVYTQPQHNTPHYIQTFIHTVSTHQHQSTPHHIHTFISKVSTHQHHNTPHHIHSIYPPYTQYPHIHATTPHTESTQLFIPYHTSIYKVFTHHSSTYHIHTSVYTVSTRMYTRQLPVMYPNIHTANHAPMPMTACTLAYGK